MSYCCEGWQAWTWDMSFHMPDVLCAHLTLGKTVSVVAQSGGSELLMTALSMPLNNCVALGKSFHFCVCVSFLI